MPAFALVAWRFLRPLLPYILSALAVLTLLYGAYSWSYNRGAHSRDAEVAALTTTIANYKTASIAAQAQNVAHVQTVETKQDAVTKGHENDYPTQLAALRANYAAYVRLHPGAPAYPSYPGKDGLSEIPFTAGKPDVAPASATVSVSDLDACAKAYVTATGLQSWIRDQAAIDRNPQ